MVAEQKMVDGEYIQGVSARNGIRGILGVY